MEYVIDGIIAPIAMETGAGAECDCLSMDGKVKEEVGEEYVRG